MDLYISFGALRYCALLTKRIVVRLILNHFHITMIIEGVFALMALIVNVVTVTFVHMNAFSLRYCSNCLNIGAAKATRMSAIILYLRPVLNVFDPTLYLHKSGIQ